MRTIKISLLLFFTIFLVSCSARKMDKSKTEKTENEHVTDKSVVNTTEGINKVVETEIDTIVKIPEKVSQASAPLEDLKEGKPLINETDDFVTETRYNPKTGAVDTKTTQKAKDIQVKAKKKETTNVQRAIVENKNIDKKTGSTSKEEKKSVDKKAPSSTWGAALLSWAWVIILIVVVAVLWYVGIIRRRKPKPEPE